MGRRSAPRRQLRFEPLESRLVLATQLVITEFMAVNDSILLDEDNDTPDWIEIYNATDAAVDLGGWHLTDDAANRQKWQFPSQMLEANDFLVVFASDKDRAVAGQPLHANFKLRGGGEYLALIEPDGTTIASQYTPQFPQQFADISFGLEMNAAIVPLVPAGAAAAAFVPTDDSLGSSWTGGAEPFAETGWIAGTTGVGYEAAAVQEVLYVSNVRGASPDSFTLPSADAVALASGSGAGVDREIIIGPDGNLLLAALGAQSVKKYDLATHAWSTFATTTLPGSATLQPSGMTLASDGNLYVSSMSGTIERFDAGTGEHLATIVTGLGVPRGLVFTNGLLHLAEGNGTDTIRRYELDGTLQEAVFASTGVNPRGMTVGPNGNLFVAVIGPSAGADGAIEQYDVITGDLVGGVDWSVGGGLSIPLDIEFANDGYAYVTDVQLDAIERFDAGTGVHAGTFAAVLDPDSLVLGVSSDSGGYMGLFDIDLEAPMHNLRASAYVRVPFTVDDPTALSTLTLRMKYDDGFVAYVNGVEVARDNAPATPTWDSAAGTTRSDDSALVFEDFDLSGHIGDLHAGTNVLAIHGLNAGVGSTDFLIVPELAGTLVSELTSHERYFPDPTPGEANSTGFLGFVGDTSFDVDRGFYDTPFDVAVTSTTADAEIRYTTDGSAPTATNGIVYDGPVAINTTTTLRAAAFKAGFQPTNIDTQTYIFLSDVVQQPADPEGFPTTWGVYGSEGPTGSPVVADYEFDPEVAIDDPRYADTIIDDLLALPTMSIVMDLDDLFDWDTGIYVDAHQREASWERPASLEMFYPDGREGFQIDAGIRTFGGYGHNAWATPKHSFRLTFKSEYGPPKLDFPLFDDSPVDRFDQLVLRSTFSDGWPDAGARPQYLRDPFMRATQLAMGQPASHGTWVHLYLNGLYWGLYNPSERPNASYAAEHFGGNKDDYDAVKHVINNDYEVIDGTGDAWSTALSLAGGGLADQTAYEQFKQYVDVESLADYMIVNMYAGNIDWPHKNWYAVRKREPGAGFTFYNWDGEYALRSDFLAVDKTGVNNPNTPARLYAGARANAEFRLMFADRVHKHLFNAGALTPEENTSRYEALAAEIDRAIVAESARWGDHEDTRRGRPYHKAPGEVFTRDDDWLPVKEMVVNSYFPQRHDIALSQFLAAGLYPSVVAPTFNQHGGMISGTFELTADAPRGTIYYTLDGSDPREVGGAVAGGTLVYSSPVTLTESTTVMARVLDGSTWSALSEADFVHVDPPSLRITEIMYNPADQTAAELAAAGNVAYGNDEFEYVELTNVGQSAILLEGVTLSGGIDFTFTGGELQPNQFVVLVHNRAAFESRYGTGQNATRVYTDRFNNGGEQVVLTDAFGITVHDFQYDDQWYPLTDGLGFSLTVVDAAGDLNDWGQPTGWRPSSFAGGSPGAADPGIAPAAGAVVINEILSNTGDVAHGDRIELSNTTAVPLDLAGWYLSDDGANLRKYEIADPTPIDAGGFVVLNQQGDFGAAFALADGGGSLYLTAGDGNGNLLGYQQALAYGAAELEITHGRYVNSGGDVDFVAMDGDTIGAANSPPAVGPVVINEIMYHPATGGDEFVELLNITDTAVPLFDPLNPQNTWSFTRGIGFTFPVGVELDAGEYSLVVSVDPETFRSDYGVPVGVQIFGPYLAFLDNGGEEVELSKPGVPAQGAFPLIRVDRVVYDDSLPWPEQADGAGPSLERIVAAEYGNDAANWSRGPVGGSPGRINVGIDTTPPTVPTGLAAAVNSGSHIDLSWQASADAESGISHYRIFRDGVPIGTSLLTTFSDVDAQAPGTFAYQVSAVNGETLEGIRTVFPVVVELVVAEFRDGTSPTAEYSGTRDATLSEDDPAANFGSSDNLVVATAGSDDPQPTGPKLFVTNSANTGGGGIVSAFELPSGVDNSLPADARLGNDREVILGLDGNLLVGNLKTHEISKFDLDTETWSTFVAMPGGGNPYGMVLVGDDLYVAAGNTNRIEKFDGNTGAHLGTTVSGLPQIPRGLAYANGLLYLTEGKANDGIFRYDLAGTLQEPLFAATGVNPRGITVGPNGNLFVAVIGSSATDGAIVQFDVDTGEVVDGGNWHTGTNLNAPLDIEFADDGFAYVTDVGRHSVERFNATTGAYDGEFAGVGTPAWLLFVEADQPMPDHLESSSLLRWDLSEIAPGTAATSAAITINVTETPTGVYDLYEVQRPWTEDEATWNQSSAGNDWETPGAKGAGDRGSVVLGTFDVGVPGAHVVDFNDDGVGLVQRWIDTPQSNHGMILVPAVATSGGMEFESREALNLAGRPSLSLTFAVIETPANVVGRHIFYNNSAFDDGSPSASPEDDDAIANDKSALRTGETATWEHYANFEHGINGVMVDISTLAGSVSAADFTFRVGNADDPTTWSLAPTPTSITVRTGAGQSDSDRITIIWPNESIQDQWLQVTVRATTATGLAAADVFYYGSAIGDTGDGTSNALVTAADVIAIRDNPRGEGHRADIANPYDINRDRLVDAVDVILARDNATGPLDVLRLITPVLPSPTPAGGESEELLQMERTDARVPKTVRSAGKTALETNDLGVDGQPRGLHLRPVLAREQAASALHRSNQFPLARALGHQATETLPADELASLDDALADLLLVDWL